MVMCESDGRTGQAGMKCSILTFKKHWYAEQHIHSSRSEQMRGQPLCHDGGNVTLNTLGL